MKSQAADQDAPGAIVVGRFDLEGNHSPYHVVEQTLTDPNHHVRAVDGVIDREHGGAFVARYAKVPGAVLDGSDSEELPALRDSQYVGASFVNPHAPILYGFTVTASGPKVPGFRTGASVSGRSALTGTRQEP